MSSLLNKIEKIFAQYGYLTGFSTFYHEDLLKKYSSKEKNMNDESVFTLYDKNKRVIRRIPKLHKNNTVKETHIDQMIEAFDLYKLPHAKSIKEKLNLLKK